MRKPYGLVFQQIEPQPILALDINGQTGALFVPVGQNIAYRIVAQFEEAGFLFPLPGLTIRLTNFATTFMTLVTDGNGVATFNEVAPAGVGVLIIQAVSDPQTTTGGHVFTFAGASNTVQVNVEFSTGLIARFESRQGFPIAFVRYLAMQGVNVLAEGISDEFGIVNLPALPDSLPGAPTIFEGFKEGAETYYNPIAVIDTPADVIIRDDFISSRFWEVKLSVNYATLTNAAIDSVFGVFAPVIKASGIAEFVQIAIIQYITNEIVPAFLGSGIRPIGVLRDPTNQTLSIIFEQKAGNSFAAILLKVAPILLRFLPWVLAIIGVVVLSQSATTIHYNQTVRDVQVSNTQANEKWLAYCQSANIPPDQCQQIIESNNAVATKTLQELGNPPAGAVNWNNIALIGGATVLGAVIIKTLLEPRR